MNCCIRLAVCFGSLSYWSAQYLSPNKFWALGSISCSRILMYWFCSKIPSTKYNLPTPCPVKHPQTIIFWSCFTIPTVHWGEYRSLCRRQTFFLWLYRKTKGDQRIYIHSSMVTGSISRHHSTLRNLFLSLMKGFLAAPPLFGDR